MAGSTQKGTRGRAKRVRVLASGSAGRLGEKIRSDLHVIFEATDGGGIELDLQSKVALYYGDAIAEQVRGTLAAFGVENARLKIVDQGALPFVIEARVETALRRAGVVPRGALQRGRKLPPASSRGKLRRSRLYLPGNEPKIMVNAGLHGSDGIILDLEDSVHAGEKDSARALVASALRNLDFGAAERMVRINQLPDGLEDLEQVLDAGPDLILVPKVERPEEMGAVDAKIEELGIDRPVWLMPIIESALGVENAFSIATASERIVALTIGLEDYTAELGVVKTVSGDETLYARTRLINAARAAGVQAIDSVFGDVGDREGLESWAHRSRALGFEGMGCIHPRQVPVIHQAFAPTPTEIDKAERIVRAFEEAERKGLAVVSLGTKMIDPPVVNRALKLVAQARAMGLLPGGEEGSRG